MKTRGMQLPELAEHSELESNHHTREPLATSTPRGAMPHLSAPDDDDDDAQVRPPPPSDEPVTPSLPESFLRKLGLAASNNKSLEDDTSTVDQLPEKELESKFVSLSLSFKTDKLTLDQRVSVQERARDLAEHNAEKEMQDMREVVEKINQIVSDDQVRDVIHKIYRHLDILEQAAARVSSRAEVYGAVQQESRMCKAMEVMVLYTENLRRIREKEEAELLEARKILSERSVNATIGGDYGGPNRRSMSVCGVNATGRPMRRRSEVVLPRVLGGVGSPSLIQNPSMDPRSRFQSAVANTSMRNAVTSSMRRASLSAGPVSPSSSLSPFGLSLAKPSPTPSQEGKIAADGDKDRAKSKEATSEDQASSNEDAYRKGFEEGFKAKMTQELSSLRDEQNSISQNLEDVMDRVEQSQMEDEDLMSRPTRLQTACSLASKTYVVVTKYDWRSNKKLIRNVTGVFFVLLAVFIVFLSPPVPTVDVQHFTKPPQ